MNRNEALNMMKQGYPMQGQDFLDDEFLVWKDGQIYCEGGYKWDIKDFENRNFEGWEIWLDINNPIDLSKQERNDLCKCGSGKKYKKCCYLTVDIRLKIWNKKVKIYNTLMKAIKNNTSVELYKINQNKKLSATLVLLEGHFKDSVYNIRGRGFV